MTTVPPRVLAAAERAFADARPPEGEGLTPADKFRVMLTAAITAADRARDEAPSAFTARAAVDDHRRLVAALRNIATIQFGRFDEMTDRVDLLREIAREALDRLGADPTKEETTS